MFPRVTHPSATPVLPRAFDLHVLSLPPAFALSQDQTLMLESDSKPGLTHVLTEVHKYPAPSQRPGIMSLETQGPASSPTEPQNAETPQDPRKDTAVRVSLPSNQIVKEQTHTPTRNRRHQVAQPRGQATQSPQSHEKEQDQQSPNRLPASGAPQ